MKPFDYCEKKILKKTSFRIAICILYFVLNMMARSIYRTFQMLEYGNGYQSSLVYMVLSEIILWAPFVFVIIRCVLKSGWRWLLVNSKRFVGQNWWKYEIYLLGLFLVWRSVVIGDMYLEFPLIGALWLSQSFGSYVLMIFTSHIFDNVGSILFFVIVPVFCSIVSQNREEV